MRAAAVLDRDHPAVGAGELVGAHPEAGLQRAGQGDEEPAGAAVRRRLPGHRAVRSVVGFLPALGSGQPAVPGQHPDPAQAEFEGHLFDLRIARVGVARHQPGVVRRGWQQVAGAQVTRLQPLAPRHPGRRQQRALAGQQHHFGHARRPVRGPHHGDRPEPAHVAGQRGRERRGGRVRTFRPYPEVAADLRLRATRLGDADVAGGQLHRGGSRLVHGRGDDLVDGEWFGRCVHTGHCRIRTGAARAGTSCRRPRGSRVTAPPVRRAEFDP